MTMEKKTKIELIILVVGIIAVIGMFLLNPHKQHDYPLYENEEDELLSISKKFMEYTSFDELGGFLVLNDFSEIPSKGNKDFKNPKNYKEIIKVPVFTKVSKNEFEIKFYTWTRDEGALINWTIRIKDKTVTSAYAVFIDTGIGDFFPRSEGVVHVPDYKWVFP
ncbi:MAG: hypothetical protein ACTSUT_18265 [Promethearchaeota archaeon]